MSQYLAFISYRHTVRDSAVSAVLIRGLENYHLDPSSPIPKKRRVFRDRDEMPTGTSLGDAIENALEESDFLIALCSEDYPASRWCMSELDFFIRKGRKERILPVLLSGTPELSVPEEIRDLPVAADLRGRRASEAVPVLLGIMSGEDPERVKALEQRWRIRTGLGIAAAFAAAALAFSAYAIHTAGVIEGNNVLIAKAAEEARAAKEEAIQERNSALLGEARIISEQAWEAIKKEDVLTAVKLALSALPEDLHGDLPVSDDAAAALRMALCLQQPTYRLFRSAEPGFAIREYSRTPYIDGLVLRGDGIAAMDYATGEFSEPGAGLSRGSRDKISEAVDRGCYRILLNKTGSSSYVVCYGPGEALCSYESVWGKEVHYTLEGKPFFADHVLCYSGGGVLLAWSDAPDPEAALFLPGTAEAAAKLDVKGGIRAADFYNEERFAAIDGDGTLGIYDASTGRCLDELSGGCRDIRYGGYGTALLYAVGDDGTGARITIGSGREILRFRAPSPIRQLDYSKEKGYLLALCEDGVYILDKDGGLLMRIEAEELPDAVLWHNGSQGNRFVMIYETRADIYVFDVERDMSKYEAKPLYHPEWPSGDKPFYSPDGAYVYLDCGGLSKWDTASGQCLWKIDGGGTLSDDGRFLWRTTNNENGLEKLDAETGELLYSVSWEGELSGNSVRLPKESPDGSLGLIITSDWCHTMLVFDAASGRQLWKYDVGNMDDDRDFQARFSDDGKEIWCLQWKLRPEDRGRALRYLCFSAEDGKLLKEEILETGGYDQDKAIFLFDDSAIAAGADFSPGVPEPFHWNSLQTNCWDVSLRLVDLSRGETAGELVFHGKQARVMLNYAGQMVLTWQMYSEDGTLEPYCCTLAADGTLGEYYPINSPEGRRLSVTKEQYGVYNGEEVYTADRELRKIRDDTLVLSCRTTSMGNAASNKITVSPDGQGCCLSGNRSTPLLVSASDLDALVMKAKKRLEKEET